MKKVALVSAIVLLALSSRSFAGIGDPWFLMYKVSGGSIVQVMGPYSSQFECMGARFQLPIGAQFLGCAQ